MTPLLVGLAAILLALIAGGMRGLSAAAANTAPARIFEVNGWYRAILAIESASKIGS